MVGVQGGYPSMENSMNIIKFLFESFLNGTFFLPNLKVEGEILKEIGIFCQETEKLALSQSFY